MSTVNFNFAHGHFQCGGELTPKLKFRRELAQDLLKNYAREEDGGGNRTQRSCTVLIPLPCELVAVAHYREMWDLPPKQI